MVRFLSATGESTERTLNHPKSDVVFLIQCGEEYKFGFMELLNPSVEPEAIAVDWVGEVSNRDSTRAPPIGQPFSGMMLGVYSFGERQPCLAPADFSYVEVR